MGPGFCLVKPSATRWLENGVRTLIVISTCCHVRWRCISLWYLYYFPHSSHRLYVYARILCPYGNTISLLLRFLSLVTFKLFGEFSKFPHQRNVTILTATELHSVCSSNSYWYKSCPNISKQILDDKDVVHNSFIPIVDVMASNDWVLYEVSSVNLNTQVTD